MSINGETADQLSRMTLQGVQIAAELSLKAGGEMVKSLAVYLYTIINDQQKVKGKVHLKALLKSNEELKLFAIQHKDLSSFAKTAKKYGVVYHVVTTEKGDNGICDIMIKAKDANKVARIADKLELATLDTKTINDMIRQERQSGTAAKEQPTINEDEHNKIVRSLMEKAMGNPTQARTVPQKNLSEPSSKTLTHSSKKPSVKKELQNIKRDLDKKQKEDMKKQKNNTRRKSNGVKRHVKKQQLQK